MMCDMTSHNEAPPREAIVAHCDVELARQVRAAAIRDQRSISGWVRATLVKALGEPSGEQEKGQT